MVYLFLHIQNNPPEGKIIIIPTIFLRDVNNSLNLHFFCGFSAGEKAADFFLRFVNFIDIISTENMKGR